MTQIFEDDKLVAFTTSWHYSNDSYTEAINKMMIINSDEIEKISDRYTIETFLKSFYEKRKGIFIQKIYEGIKEYNIPIIGINRKYIRKSLMELEKVIKGSDNNG